MERVKAVVVSLQTFLGSLRRGVHARIAVLAGVHAMLLLTGFGGDGPGERSHDGAALLVTSSEPEVDLDDLSVWRFSPMAPLVPSRFAYQATRLRDGNVLVTGGIPSTGALPSFRLYDPSTNSWSPTIPCDACGRMYHVAAPLQDGRVLLAGGTNLSGNTLLRTAALYDPSTNTVTSTASMATARRLAQAVVLQNGQVLVIGGLARCSSPEATIQRARRSTIRRRTGGRQPIPCWESGSGTQRRSSRTAGCSSREEMIPRAWLHTTAPSCMIPLQGTAAAAMGAQTVRAA
jgi:hypothetical protein